MARWDAPCVIAQVGRKWGTLVDVGSLDRYKIPLRELATSPSVAGLCAHRVMRALTARRGLNSTDSYKKAVIDAALTALAMTADAPSSEGNEKMKQINKTAKTTTAAAPKPAAKAKKKKAATVAAKKEPAAKPSASAKKAAKLPTKKEQLAAMLRRDGGATVPQIMLEFGWLAHTARAAICIAGKVPGRKITNEKFAGMVRVYRMAP